MRAVAVLGVGVPLRLVVGGDVGVGHLEGGPHVGRDLLERRLAASASGTRSSSTSAPSKRAVSSRSASSPRARTSASSARTSSIGGSTCADGRGRRRRRSPSTPRRSSRCSTWRGYVRAAEPPETGCRRATLAGCPWTPPTCRRCPPPSTSWPSASRRSPTSYSGLTAEDVAADLYEVERHLHAASRRLHARASTGSASTDAASDATPQQRDEGAPESALAVARSGGGSRPRRDRRRRRARALRSGRIVANGRRSELPHASVP